MLCLAWNVEFDSDEVERLFAESDENVSGGQYTFWASGRLSVSGRVDEYEPGTVWRSVQSYTEFSPQRSGARLSASRARQ